MGEREPFDCRSERDRRRDGSQGGQRAHRRQQLGERFVLKEFHDEFMRKGRIPLALIRYEMTGLTDEMEKLR